MNIKVKELKTILENALEVLDDYEDDDKIETESNTRFVSEPYIGMRRGFVSLNELEESINIDEIDESMKSKSEKLIREKRKLEDEITRKDEIVDILMDDYGYPYDTASNAYDELDIDIRNKSNDEIAAEISDWLDTLSDEERD